MNILAFGCCQFVAVITSEEAAFEDLYTNDGKHEFQHVGNEQNVSNCLHSHQHALDHALEAQALKFTHDSAHGTPVQACKVKIALLVMVPISFCSPPQSESIYCYHH